MDIEMRIVVVSDIHLGYEQSNSEEFEKFLDWLLQRSDFDYLVILGDFIDMWRQDVSGLFLEFHEILEKILELQKKIKGVYCIAGNHDYHLRELKDDEIHKIKYPLAFLPDLEIDDEEVTYIFKHGHEFDSLQQPPIMELLCHNFSNKTGTALSNFWDIFVKKFGNDILDSLKDLFKIVDRDKYLTEIQLPPNQRSTVNISEVEKKACSSVSDGQMLIFGHTHRPFVSTKNNVVNTGSWLNDETINNTYVEIDGTTIHLMVYNKNEITEREACPS